MSEAQYDFDSWRLRCAREKIDLTLPQIAVAAGISVRALCFYLAGDRQPRAELLPPLARAVGLADPLDLCDLSGGERIVHLRVRVGKSRSTIAAQLGWHLETYREWEAHGRARGKMGPLRAARAEQLRHTPFFTQRMQTPGRVIEGVWQGPIYGLIEYGDPDYEAVFAVPAPRLYAAMQRTRAALAALPEGEPDPEFESDLAEFRSRPEDGHATAHGLRPTAA